jgi:hypothetical protein
MMLGKLIMLENDQNYHVVSGVNIMFYKIKTALLLGLFFMYVTVSFRGERIEPKNPFASRFLDSSLHSE